jgi:hypothetical protein
MTIDQHPRPLVTIGFKIAACVNILGSLLVSAGFTNPTPASLDPVVFSNFGFVAIMLWGLAYLAVSRSYQHVPYLVMVFVLEKLVYTAAWILWLSRNRDRLSGIISETPVTGIFFLGYGLVDFLFGVFFAWVAITILRERSSNRV